MEWICLFSDQCWNKGRTPQEAYDNLCVNEGEDFPAESCTFYKETNVRITPPVGATITEI